MLLRLAEGSFDKILSQQLTHDISYMSPDLRKACSTFIFAYVH